MQRDISKKLEHWKSKSDRKPLILKGPRQVGKTYSLQKFGSESFKTTHYFDFERDTALRTVFEPDLQPERVLRDLSILRDINIDSQNDLVIFDEIQNCPKALTALKYFHQDMPELAICSAGSLLGVHLGESSFPVGKVDFLDLNPMTFAEFLAASGEDKLLELLESFSPKDDLSSGIHERLWHLLKCYFVVGGMPEVVGNFISKHSDLNAALSLARETQQSLVTSFLADMAKHSGMQNSMHLERLWRNIPSQLGRDQDTGASKFVFKDVLPGKKGYASLAGTIDWLEKAGLIIKVPIVNKAALPFSAYSKENTFKLFFFDIGLLGAVGELPAKSIISYDYGSFKGFFAENFVLQELNASSCVRQLYSWREKESEIEFLTEVDGQIIPIEVKSGLSKKTRSLNVYLEKYSPDKAIILSRQYRIKTFARVEYWPLYVASRIV